MAFVHRRNKIKMVEQRIAELDGSSAEFKAKCECCEHQVLGACYELEHRELDKEVERLQKIHQTLLNEIAELEDKTTEDERALLDLLHNKYGLRYSLRFEKLLIAGDAERKQQLTDALELAEEVDDKLLLIKHFV